MIHVLWLMATVATTAYEPATPNRATCEFTLPTAFKLTAEAGTGAYIGAGSPVPWSVSSRVHPTIAFGEAGKLRLAGVIGAGYVNPGWEVLYGGRLGFRPFQAPLGLLGIEVAVEAVWGSKGRNPGSVALTIDVGEVLTLNARGGPDLGNGRGFFEVGVGVYPRTLSPPEPAPIEIPPMAPEPVFHDFAAQATFIELALLLQKDVDNVNRVDCAMVSNLEDVLDLEESNPSQSLAAFDTRLRQNGLDAFADEISGTEGIIQQAKLDHRARHGELPDPSDAESIQALTAGMRRTVVAVHDSSLPTL